MNYFRLGVIRSLNTFFFLNNLRFKSIIIKNTTKIRGNSGTKLILNTQKEDRDICKCTHKEDRDINARELHEI